MDEFAVLGAGVLCVAPVVAIVWAAIAQSGRVRELRAMLAQQDEALRALGDQNVRLHHRLLIVEGRMQSGARPAPAAEESATEADYAGQADYAADYAAEADYTAERAAQAQAAFAAQAQTAGQVPPADTSLSQDPSHPAPAWAPAAGDPELGTTSGGDSLPPSQPSWQPAPEPTPPPRKIAWEECIGVRGAAALGGVVLVIAGLYFFKYSMDHGLIPEPVRFVIGMIVGVGAIALAELKLRPKYEVMAGWLTGAGIGVLYIASWAGRTLYELYPSGVAALLMIAVTATCVVLAIRRRSLPVAILGLCGGFITPLALSTGSDHPISLFGYLLVLDIAMLFVAIRQRWAWLAGLSLVATFLYQAGWMFARMDDERRWIGALVLVVFAALFAFVPMKDTPEDKQGVWRRIRGAAVILPLLLSVTMGLRSDLSEHLGITAGQLLLLTAAAAVLGRRKEMSLFAVVAALASQGALVGTVILHVHSASVAWALAGISMGMAAMFHLGSEFGDGDARERATLGAVASSVAALMLGFLLSASLAAATLPAMALMIAPAALLCRSARRPAWKWVPTGAMALAAFGVGALFTGRSGLAELPEPTTNLGALLLLAFAAHVPGVLARRTGDARPADHGAAIVAIVFGACVALTVRLSMHPALPLHAASVLLVLSTLFAAARSGAGAWLVVAAAMAALQSTFLAERIQHGHGWLFASMLAQVVLFVLAPFVFPRLSRSGWAWRAAGGAVLLFLFPLRNVYVELLSAQTQGLLPVALAVLTLGGALLLRLRPPPEDVALSAKVWLVGATAALITVAIPMQLENEWVTIGWALEVLVFTALWRRYDHPGLKYTTLLLATLVFVRLAFNPFVLDYGVRSGWRVVNWISYTYLLPAAALFGAYALMNPLEVVRRRTWEPGPAGQPWIAPAYGGAGIVLVFLWLNLMVFDFFATGPALTIPTDRLPARDLSLSMVWAVYAGLLLAGGLLRKSKGLRYASLALLLLTCGKVFLYDLGNLEDLYRVASLAGLALTLIAISLVYKRFVFTDATAPGDPS